MNRIIVVFLLCFPHLIAAQDDASGRETLLRFTTFGLDGANGEYVLVGGGQRTQAFAIPDNGFSVPIPAPVEGAALALGMADDDPFQSRAAINLPNSGKRFLVIVVPGPNDALRTIVVRADDAAFRPGQVMILNLATEPLAGELGGERLRFEPGSRTIFRPRRNNDLANYQVRFYQARDGELKLFAANLWPYFDKKRAFVFLFTDPATGSPTYRAIDEFTDWLED